MINPNLSDIIRDALDASTDSYFDDAIADLTAYADAHDRFIAAIINDELIPLLSRLYELNR